MRHFRIFDSTTASNGEMLLCTTSKTAFSNYVETLLEDCHEEDWIPWDMMKFSVIYAECSLSYSVRYPTNLITADQICEFAENWLRKHVGDIFPEEAIKNCNISMTMQ